MTTEKRELRIGQMATKTMLRVKRQFVDTVMRRVRGDLKRAAEALRETPHNAG